MRVVAVDEDEEPPVAHPLDPFLRLTQRGGEAGEIGVVVRDLEARI